MDSAPNLEFINAKGHELIVSCKRCRRIAKLDVRRLRQTENARLPISRLQFRCEECGRRVTPIVTSHRDEKTGWSRVWPF